MAELHGTSVPHIVPTDIFLLETFSSVEYLAELRDTWGEMIEHLDKCLARFVKDSPGYRWWWPFSQQPDGVWSDRVLPNFRSSHAALVSGVIALSHGDPDGLYSAHGPHNDFHGQKEYSDAWLTKADLGRYGDSLAKSSKMAGNIAATIEPYWSPGDLDDFQKLLAPVTIPVSMPAYRLNKSVTVKTGDRPPRIGVYVPDKEHSIAAFITTGKPAPDATVVIGVEDVCDDHGVKYAEQPELEEQSCVWTLIERVVPCANER